MFRLWYFLKRKTPQNFKPVILITGCSSGLGFAIAQLLYRHTQYRIVITARSERLTTLSLQFTENDRCWVRALDVNSADERHQLISEIESSWGGVNILINNAGIAYRSVVEHMSDSDEQLQMSTNYFGPVALIRLVLPKMRELGRGKIINISSVSGMLAMPTMASYSASKYALEGVSEALWYETKPLGINVCLIQPGFVRSQSFERVYSGQHGPGSTATLNTHAAEENLSTLSANPYQDYYDNMIPFVRSLMHRSWADPAKIARLVLKVIQMENPPLWIPATIDAIFFYYIRRLVPRRWLLPLLFRALPNAKRWGQGYSRRRL